MKAKVTSLLIFLLLFPVMVYAQAGHITGTVTDSSGEPLMGVSVLVKGTSSGAATDLDGNFSVKASVGQVLTFSYIGYTTQEIKITNTDPLNVVMEENTKTLDEEIGRATRLNSSHLA